MDVIMQVRCPVCKMRTTWEENQYKPFCSERCKLIDLGMWADEKYRVPGEQTENPPDEDTQNRRNNEDPEE